MPAEMESVRPMLLDLLVEQQRYYKEQRMSRAQIDSELLGALKPDFAGQNVMLTVREAGELAGLCWCVFFDPGTGKEAEVAELYVRHESRGRGYARAMLRRAVDLFTERGITLAAVWTHADNQAALRLYQEVGFKPAEQAVLTWHPPE